MALTQIGAEGLKDDAVDLDSISDESIDEARLKISNAGTNGQYLQKQSGNTGGLTWADVPAGVGGATGLDVNDNVKIRAGTGNDLEIYHNGSNSYIDDTGTGDLFIRGSNDLYITNPDGTETKARFATDGAVYLYHDNTLKLETESTGVTISGALSFGDGTGAGGTNKVSFGASDDLNIYHDATANSNAGASIIKDTGAGGLWLGTSDFYVKTGDLSETMIRALPNGAVELYHDNTKVVETSANGLAFPAGKGIDFSATGDSTGTMSNEVLDDYEEGTWDPVLYSTGGGDDFGYTSRNGFYQKVGGVVHYYVNIQWTKGAGVTAGYVYCKGFPFTTRPNAGSYYYIGSNMELGGLDANRPFVCINANGNNTIATYNTGGSTGLTGFCETGDIGSSGSSWFSLTVFTNA